MDAYLLDIGYKPFVWKWCRGGEVGAVFEYQSFKDQVWLVLARERRVE
jgi:hypothetical protein